ncbi:MAG TPA: ScyD/ScyE family protein, partial [Glaciihabitans sp.]|nr:ScyD/ScyE family protein [Glaciihabitans sp.]
MTKQRWITAGAALAAVALIPTAGAFAAPTSTDAEGPRVVAEGLNNPRQLSFSADGQSLIVAEAGRGGDNCMNSSCVGLTGAISLVEDPDSESPETSVAISGFFSMASPDGSFAVGSNGAVGVDFPEGGYLVAGSDPAQPPMQGGSLLGAINAHSDEPLIFTIANLWAAEQEQNPDGAQLESNPYGVLFVDPTPHEDEGADGYALVADAAANTVWKVEPRYEQDGYGQQEVEAPDITVTVFATYPTTALPDGTDDPTGPAEFVPTSLATDEEGAIYVG